MSKFWGYVIVYLIYVNLVIWLGFNEIFDFEYFDYIGVFMIFLIEKGYFFWLFNIGE